MQFKVFNNEILTPHKCGTTYLEKVFPNDIQTADYRIKDSSFDDKEYNMKIISTIIIREPFEHLQSALHTEIFSWYLSNPSESLSIDIVTPLIKNFINTDDNQYGTTHWDVNYYEYLYKFWKGNRDLIKIIHISNLSPFLKERYNIDIPHDRFSYGIPAQGENFKYSSITKQELSKWIETNLPELWYEVIKELPKADKFYNLMINGEICEMYELEEQIPELEEWKKKFWKITPIKKSLI